MSILLTIWIFNPFDCKGYIHGTLLAASSEIHWSHVAKSSARMKRNPLAASGEIAWPHVAKFAGRMLR